MTYNDLFIDFDDTLYDTRGNAILSLQELFEWARLGQWFDDAEEFYNAYWQTNVELWAQYSRNEITRDYLIVERFRRPLALRMPSPTADYCLEISDKFLEFCSCKPGLVDGARDLVEYLRNKGYRMHICSNGFHEVQYKKLTACGLIDFFDTIVLSEDAGANKPSAQFFDYAMRQTGAETERTLMIGDNYNTDIIGAKNAGLTTMLFNRWGTSDYAPEMVDYKVEKLSEIKKIL